jgi:hypothetical protein
VRIMGQAEEGLSNGLRVGAFRAAMMETGSDS